jgi:hypothetical protein
MPITFALSGQLLQSLNTDIGNAKGFAQALSAGTVQAVLLAGRNPAAPTAALGDIWGYPAIAAGQPNRTLPSAGFTLAVVSDSVADIMTSGTGAWTVAVSYLDTNYLPHTALYQLNGQTAVTVATSIDGGAGGTVSNAFRINGSEVYTTGTGLANAGNIFVCDSTNTYTAGVPQTTTKVFDCILIGDNNDASSQFTMPVGYTGITVQFIPSINDVTATAKYGRVAVSMTNGSDGIFHRFDLGGVSSNNNPVPIAPSCFPVVVAKSELRIQCQVSATTELACVNFLVIWPTPKP